MPGIARLLCLCLAIVSAGHAADAFSLRPSREEHDLPGWRGEQQIVGDPVVYGKVRTSACDASRHTAQLPQSRCFGVFACFFASCH